MFFKCKHKYNIINLSNILQLDDMGYPLMLCLLKCSKCGKIKQQWIDVPKELLKDNKYKILEWEKIQNGKTD